MNATAAGLLLLVLAGAMNGCFTLPMKFTTKWAWENIWLAWTIFALGVFPIGLTLLTNPSLSDVYSRSGMAPVLIAAGCGAGWGISQVFFGLAVNSVGIALAFSVILGISTVVGSLIPFFTDSKYTPFSSQGLAILGGVALVVVGVLICAKAGRAREAALGTGPKKGKASVGRGLLFCLFSGLGSALVGLGLQYGQPAAQAAQDLGADPMYKNMAAFMPLMVAGGIPNAIYCIYLMKKNATAARFRSPETRSYWFLGALMAVGWFGSTVMYGISADKLGIVVAWPAFMSLIVISAMIVGVATGEWKGSGTRPLRIMYGGLATLVLAILVLSRFKS
jgi:L-rhamnose-H+ transport protein